MAAITVTQRRETYTSNCRQVHLQATIAASGDTLVDSAVTEVDSIQVLVNHATPATCSATHTLSTKTFTFYLSAGTDVPVWITITGE